MLCLLMQEYVDKILFMQHKVSFLLLKTLAAVFRCFVN